MLIVRSVTGKIRTMPMLYLQLLFVGLAFVVMVVSSSFYVNDMLRNHLRRDAMDLLYQTQLKIEAELLEPETTLMAISNIIREEILQGGDADAISRYMQTADSALRRKTKGFKFDGFFGYFNVFGGIFMTTAEWAVPEGYDATELPWYEAAVEAGDKLAVSPIYMNIRLNEYIVTYAQRIFDDNGKPLGVLALNTPLDHIISYVADMRLTKGSYGVFHNEKMDIFYHPDSDTIGKNARVVSSDISLLANEVLAGGDLFEREVKNYEGDLTVVFSTRLKNGWILYTVTPKAEYYQNLRDMESMLSIIGVCLAAALSVILLRVDLVKKKLDEERYDAQVASQAKSDFLARMSHEIRTPMNAILGITEILTRNETLSPHTREALNKIDNAGNLMLGIINDILDLSKIEAGKLELASSEYETASLINDTVQLNIMRIDSKPIELKLNVSENTPLKLVGDELRIKQILNNLLSNAFKYTANGVVELSVTVETENEGKKSDVTLVFRVSDTGQGMTKDEVDLLFDEYTRFHMEANRTTEGTGLGLSITQKLVHLMNGMIAVESEFGKGSSFTVRLPQRNAGVGVLGKELAGNLQNFRTDSVKQISKAQIVFEPMPYGSVLLVDDVESNLYVAKGLLAPYGLSVDTVMSGFEAIDKIKNGGVYDIVFMDHMMPKMDGVEATKVLRGLGYGKPIVALTANAVIGQADIFLTNGFDDFISKPVDVRQLNAVLKKYVRDKQPRADNCPKEHIADETMQPHVEPRLAEIFARDASKAVATLEALHKNRDNNEDKDIRLYTINVHAMKSALAIIGESGLSAFAAKLEQAGWEKDTAVMSAETPIFLDELRAVIEKLTPLKEEDCDPVDADYAYLRERLLVVKEACEIYDKKGAKGALTELRQKIWTRPIRELLGTMAEQLLCGDFDEVSRVAESIIEKI